MGTLGHTLRDCKLETKINHEGNQSCLCFGPSMKSEHEDSAEFPLLVVVCDYGHSLINAIKLMHLDTIREDNGNCIWLSPWTPFYVLSPCQF
jgi:hypothetical protein